MIEIKNLNFIFDKIHILKNINLSLNEGEIIGVIGKSGSGKSIFLKILAAVIKGYIGEITYNNRSLSSYMKNDLLKTVSYLNRNTPDNPEDTIFNFSLLSRMPYKNMFKPFSEYDIQITDDFLKSLDLFDIKDKKLGYLSDSVLRTVQIAHSFIREAAVLILDNPTNDVDLYTVGRIRKTILKYSFNGDKIVIIASNDINFICQIADRILLIDDGTIVDDGPIEIIDADFIKKFFNTEVLISRNIYNGRPEIHIFPED